MDFARTSIALPIHPAQEVFHVCLSNTRFNLARHA